MAFFNTLIDYQGQDLHMLRNGKPFPLHKFFDENAILNYTFRLNLNVPNNLSYENIVITKNTNQNNVTEVYITATVNTNPNQRMDNFFVTVNDSYKTVVILIHLHDNIDKAWCSPSTLSFRKGMAVQFGVLASFTDGDYADLSFYPDLQINKTNATTAVLLDENTQRIIWNEEGTYPVSGSKIDDIVQITLPEFMYYPNDAISASGTLEILEDFGTLKLHTGNVTEIDERLNILFLSDGFNKSQLKEFEKKVTDFNKNAFMSNVYAPWNLFKDKINLWTYFTHDNDDNNENLSTLEGEHIVLSSGNTSLVSELYNFIDFFDNEIVLRMPESLKFNKQGTEISYPLENFVQNFRDQRYPSAFINYFDLTGSNLQQAFPLINVPVGLKILTLSELCALVGLPSEYDVKSTVTFTNKVTQWRALNWIPNIRVEGETAGGTFFLHSYIFKIWQKLAKRKFLEKSNTTYGVSNTMVDRKSLSNFKPSVMVSPGITKFPPALYKSEAIKTFGKFISRIGNNDFEKFGLNYFNKEGEPIKGKTGDSNLDKILKTSDNIVILSRVRSNGLYGANLGYIYSDLTVYRSTISLQGRVEITFTCNSGTGNIPIKYFQGQLNTKDTNNQVLNTVIHEFSHNYLRDEYSRLSGDLTKRTEEEQEKMSEDLKASNLQTGLDLKNDQTNSEIDGNKIKWRWPRVRKIGKGFGSLIEESANMYKCTVITNPPNRKFETLFNENDKVLLRRRFLFDTKYFVCTVKSVATNSSNNSQEIQLELANTETIDLDDFNAGFFVIQPFWREGTQPEVYQELVHHQIRDAISNSNRAMVEEDDGKNNEAQKIDEAFLNINNNRAIISAFGEKNKFKIVGLYAGGLLSYDKGIYHASGFCLMRGNAPAQQNEFCPICSYILTDYIDPLKHPFMNEKYLEYKNINP